jgi:hypothetical protein
LRKALEREPQLRQYLRSDADLAGLREEPEFERLVSG